MVSRNPRMRAAERAQDPIRRAAEEALRGYLALAREAILDGAAPVMRADAHPEDLPPNLEAWPDSDVWSALVRDHIAPEIGVAFDLAFDAASRSDVLQFHRYRQTFLDQVFDRLSSGLWGDGVFERIRGDLAEGLDAGESIGLLRERISGQLQVDKYSYLADRIARTESHTAVEGGTWSAHRAWEEASGEELHQQWLATADTRTRDTHMAASGQRVRLTEPFLVGGEQLPYPGAPEGSAEETINCRCTTLVGTLEELDDLTASAADLQGSAMSTATEHDPRTTQTRDQDTDEFVTVTVTDTESQETVTTSGHWVGVLAPLDVRGDDRVLISPESDDVLTADHMWLSWQEQSSMGHDGKVAIGVIDQVWVENGALWGRGRFDMRDDTAAEIARKVEEGFAGTISIDMTDLIDATITYGLYDRDDQPVDIDGWDYDELYDAFMAGDIRELRMISGWRLGGATLVQDPAFHTSRNGSGSAFIEITDPPTEESGAETAAATPAREEDSQMAAIMAAAGVAPDSATWAEQVAEKVPMEPPASWFQDPNLPAPTKVRVTDDGRVYGHIACWNTNHISYNGQSVRPPRSRTNYSQYRRNRVRCADGSLAYTGALVMGTGHADLHASPGGAMQHYDDTGYAAADVAVGEDRHGIWFAGALKPGVSALQVLTLDRYSLSGDWRNGELVGVCVVNVPGFPIDDHEAKSGLALAASGAPITTPTPKVRVAGGEQCALVASGVLPMKAGHGTTDESMQAMRRAFTAWMTKIDKRFQELHDEVRGFGANAGRGLHDDIDRMAREIHRDDIEEAARSVNGGH